MTRTSFLVGVLCAAIALLLPANSVAAPTDTYRGATKVKDLVLTLASSNEPESGSTVDFTGSAPAALEGVQVVLRRQVVSDGVWVKVSTATINTGGNFSIEGVATGVGANKWQVQAIEKVGSGKKAVKTRHVSAIVNTTVFSWYYLTDGSAVDSYWMETGPVTIGGQGHPKSVYGYSYAGDYGRAAWVEYNLSYRCKSVNAKIGVDDDAESGFRAKFYILLDGAETGLGQLGLGPAKEVTVDSASRLRVRLEVRPGDGIPGSEIDGSPSFGDVRGLCSGRP